MIEEQTVREVGLALAGWATAAVVIGAAFAALRFFGPRAYAALEHRRDTRRIRRRVKRELEQDQRPTYLPPAPFGKGPAVPSNADSATLDRPAPSPEGDNSGRPVPRGAGGRPLDVIGGGSRGPDQEAR
jgi:hypothetical protein